MRNFDRERFIRILDKKYRHFLTNCHFYHEDKIDNYEEFVKTFQKACLDILNECKLETQIEHENWLLEDVYVFDLPEFPAVTYTDEEKNKSMKRGLLRAYRSDVLNRLVEDARIYCFGDKEFNEYLNKLRWAEVCLINYDTPEDKFYDYMIRIYADAKHLSMNKVKSTFERYKLDNYIRENYQLLKDKGELYLLDIIDELVKQVDK